MNNINNTIYIQKSAYNLRQTTLFVHLYWRSTTLYSYKMQLKWKWTIRKQNFFCFTRIEGLHIYKRILLDN